MVRTSPLYIYRWIVFLLAAWFAVYHIWTGDYSNFGGPFRKLTFWGLFLSFFAASRMIAIMEHRTTRSHDVTAMVAAVVNGMVVFLYWRLYFEDPALVHDSGNTGPWWDNYYLHLVGPALQIFDAIFLKRAFSKPLKAVVPLLLFVSAYVLWGELALQPLSDLPSGSVTSGLPYPFLNNMELGARAGFYGTNLGFSVVLLALLSAIAWVANKALGPKARQTT